jgi:hypothetical protein
MKELAGIAPYGSLTVKYVTSFKSLFRQKNIVQSSKRHFKNVQYAAK